ncbi:inter-alpha-trypsin inhibitor heavy chain H4-like [Argonauta hians]
MLSQLFLLLMTSVVMETTARTLPRGLEAKLTSLHVTSDIKFRFAMTQISMTYHNPYNAAVPANLNVNMPKNSFVSNFSMAVDGKITVGEVKEKEEARHIYDQQVQAGQSAGHIAIMNRFTNFLDISVNVEPDKYVVYNVTYQELLTRQGGKYRHTIHLSNGEIIDDFLVEVFITDFQDIIGLHVPKIKDDKLTDVTDDGDLDSAAIEYSNSKEVYIKYNPSRQQQIEISNGNGVAGLFKVLYDVDREENSNSIYAIDGYFVHFFTPNYSQNLPKRIIFMLDVSGSMGGTKLKQLKEAMKGILDQLNPAVDKFLIGKFSTDVLWMQNDFLSAVDSNINLAKTFVTNMSLSGVTNINSALLDSIGKFQSVSSVTAKNIILFLTDGKQTSGERSSEVIKENVKRANKNASIFTLGFGEKCDIKFLREIASENGGFNRKIYEDADSKLQIKGLYNEISNIVLKDISISYLNSTFKTSETNFSSYIHGTDIVVSGLLKYKHQPSMEMKLQMTNYTGKDSKILKIPIDDITFDDEFDDIPENPKLLRIQSFSNITEKTYVCLTLNQYLENIKGESMRKRIIDLALKYNLVTPLTSMVVTKTNVKTTHFGEDKETVKGTTRPPSVSHGLFGLQRPVRPPVVSHRNFDQQHRFNPPVVSHGLFGLQRPVRPPVVSHRNFDQQHRFMLTTGFHHRFDPTTTTTVTDAPILLHRPGIVIKPTHCSSNLCFPDKFRGTYQSKIELLTDKIAKIYIYGFKKNIIDIDGFASVIVRISRKEIKVTPTAIIMSSGKTHPIGQRKELKLKLKKFLELTLYFHERNSEKYITLHFGARSKFIRPKGIFGDYFTALRCDQSKPNTLTLNNDAATYRKIEYISATGSFEQCFKK